MDQLSYSVLLLLSVRWGRGDECDYVAIVAYRISSIKRPGVYLLAEFADLALIQGLRLLQASVY